MKTKTLRRIKMLGERIQRLNLPAMDEFEAIRALRILELLVLANSTERPESEPEGELREPTIGEAKDAALAKTGLAAKLASRARQKP